MIQVGAIGVSDTGEVTESKSPLLGALDTAQLLLLDAIWRPVVRGIAPWPVWDYVERDLYRRSEPITDAANIFDSLPSVPIPSQVSQRYGLVWMAGNTGAQPTRSARVGLTIAGLAALGRTRPDAKIFADALTSFIAMLAEAERNITPDPNQEVKHQLSLSTLLDGQVVHTDGSQFGIPPSVVVEALRREYATPHISGGPHNSGAGSDPYVADLSPWLRPFFGITDAADYLARVAATSRPRATVVPISPLTLPQSLDYLSIVLAHHNNLDIKRLVGTANASSFARLALDVADETDFLERIGALADVLNGLDVPPLDADALLPDYGGRQPGTLERLKRHLVVQVDATSAVNIGAAIEDLKATMTMRGAAVHTDVAVRQQSQRACSRLELAWPIRDWPNAWHVVRARASLAFDAIRQEIQISR